MTLNSTKNAYFGKGLEIEPNTFINSDKDDGDHKHHYSSEEEVRELLKNWYLLNLEDREQEYQRMQMPGTAHWTIFARKKADPKSYIGQIVRVEIDRPLGSRHPKYDTHIYETNYGFVPGTVSGDGEELDVYVLGVNDPLKTYEGRCIAYIHRLDDDDDKLIVVPDGLTLSNQEILEMTHFQEKYFKPVVCVESRT